MTRLETVMLLILILLTFQVVLVQLVLVKDLTAGAAMFSRMTAGVPTAEPDGGQVRCFLHR